MSDTGGHAPNWYPDPMGRHEYRWYDGTTWTDQVSSHGKQSIDPVTGTSPVPARDVGADQVAKDLQRAGVTPGAAQGGGHRVVRQVVVGPLHVEGEEHHRAGGPAGVLAVGGVGRLAALTFQGHRVAAEALAGREERMPLEFEALLGVVAAGARPVAAPAVGPVVVAGQKHEWMARALEQVEPVHVQVVVASILPALDVSDMQHESEVLLVEPGNDLLQPQRFPGEVGRIAKDGKAEGRLVVRRARTCDTQQRECNGGGEEGA